MQSYPCAKINIGLHVVERRPDGYHNLETIFYPIPLRDELTVERAEEDSLEVTGIPVAGNWRDNLVYRVVTMLREEGHAIPPLRIRLKKNIPSGAGLGGGSSDAASMMKMLNEMCGLHLTTEEMEKCVGRLGADCPFFIRCTPVYATGTGNVFTPIDLDLSGMFLVLIKPDDFVSTKEAYANITPHKGDILLGELQREQLHRWPDMVRNDFEDSVFPAHPTVAHIKQQLYKVGARYACMSGSGSSVFGLFDGPVEVSTPHFLFTATL
ncbi:MAG: 4-(cytidine 5'-diphospho)-2-C-methyl-D-erythritol kinase [Bacteroidaceae bacterium]|nr:4-(cytidine 5'-diphospho)-2-C-methyl-D-erythritol kinase [Bacteroidaceae bacterium]